MLFRHLKFQKCSGPGVFCVFWFGNVLGKGVQFFISPLATWICTGCFSEPAKTTKARGALLFSFFAHLKLLSSDSFSSLILFSSLTLPSCAFHVSTLPEVWLQNFLPPYLGVPYMCTRNTRTTQRIWESHHLVLKRISFSCAHVYFHSFWHGCVISERAYVCAFVRAQCMQLQNGTEIFVHTFFCMRDWCGVLWSSGRCVLQRRRWWSSHRFRRWSSWPSLPWSTVQPWVAAPNMQSSTLAGPIEQASEERSLQYLLYAPVSFANAALTVHYNYNYNIPIGISSRKWRSWAPQFFREQVPCSICFQSLTTCHSLETYL